MTKISRRHILASTGAAIVAPLFMPYVARAAVRKLRFGHNNSTASGPQAAAVEMQKYLAEKSQGRLVMDIYPSSQLGNDSAMVKAVAEGTLDCTMCGGGAMASLATDIELLDMPFLFTDLASARKAYDGPVADFISNKIKGSGALYIGAGENGFRHVTANKPVRTPADIAGLKIRVQATKLQLAVFKGIGSAPEGINFSEVAEAMRVGRIEAQENPIGLILSNDWIAKLQSHISLTGHIYSQLGVLFSGDVMDELSEADRAIIRGGGMAAAKASRVFADQAASTGLEKLKSAGMTIVTDVDKPAFQKAIDDMKDQLKAVANADTLAQIRKLAT